MNGKRPGRQDRLSQLLIKELRATLWLVVILNVTVMEKRREAQCRLEEPGKLWRADGSQEGFGGPRSVAVGTRATM